MSAFGPTQAYRDATGRIREGAEYNWDQMRQYLWQAEDNRLNSDRIRNFLEQFNLGRYDAGYASPDQIRGRGQEIMPIDDVLNSRRNRLDNIAARFGDRPNPMSGLYDRYNDQAGDLTRTGETQQGIIDDLYATQLGREEGASRDIVGNIADTDRAIRGGINDTFGGLRSRNSGMTNDIARAIESGYGGMRGSNASLTNDIAREGSSTYGRLRGQNQDVTGSLRGDWLNTFGDLDRRRDSTYGSTRADLARTVGGLEGGAQQTADTIGSQSRDAYGRLRGSAGSTFGDSIADAKTLDATGDLRAAQRARSFAPAVAATAQRLRRAGVGPNDMQYIQSMSEIERDQARAMDDEQAKTRSENVDRVNRLRQQGLQTDIGLTQDELSGNERNLNTLRDTMERLGMQRYIRGENLALSEMSDAERQALSRETGRQRLDLGALDRDINLSEGGLNFGAGARERGLNRDLSLGENQLSSGISNLNRGMDRDISLGVGQSDRSTEQAGRTGQDYRDEIRRGLGSRNNMDMARADANFRLQDTMYGRAQDWRNQGNQLDLLNRDMWRQDWDTESDLAREQNNEDDYGLNMRDRQYNRGQEWIQNNYGIQDTAAGNLAQIMARDQARQMDAARLAQGWGDRANSAYSQVQQQEAGRGGWGTRLLGAAAAIGANFIPGVGPAISQGITGMMGAGGFGGMMPGGGSGGGQMFGGPSGGGQYGGGWGGGGSPYSFSWGNVANTFRNGMNTQANNAATQQGYNRGQMSTAQIAPGQQATTRVGAARPSWLQQYQQYQYGV